jgi:hypothetical protein
MTNSIALANKFMPILDEIYKRESLTSRLDALTKPVNFAGANEVKVFKTSMTGMGTYDRSTGYPAGDVTGTWETISLAASRGRAFSVDRMDNEESLGMAFGTLAAEFIRTQVVPEVDAYRFAAWAGTAGVTLATPAALAAAADVLAAVDVANGVLDVAEVPTEGRILWISSVHYRLLMAAVTRSLENQSAFDRRLKTLDGVDIVSVPQGRLNDVITLDPGATAVQGGFTATGDPINFILMHPTAVDQATKLAQLKIFSPDENQLSDSWLFQYRLYHDAWVYDNKLAGVYVHAAS